MAKHPRNIPTQNELDSSVTDILYVMIQCSAYFSWHVHIKPKLNQPDPALVKIVQNSVIDGSLLSIRKLNEFFKTRPKVDEKDDDLRAYDFLNFNNVGEFLNSKSKEEINKRIGHLTLKEAREGTGLWEIHKAVKLALSKSFSFLDFLIDEFYVNKPEKKGFAIEAKALFQRLSEQMEKEKKIEENRKKGT